VLETVETSFIFMKLILSHGTFSISFFIYIIYHVSIFNATRECASSSTQVVKDLTDSLLLFVSPGKVHVVLYSSTPKQAELSFMDGTTYITYHA
jgi:hypothetical protein